MQAGHDADNRLSRRDDELIQRYVDSKSGWSRFRRQLFDLSPRWQWWSLVLLTRRLPPPVSMPYPKIVFADHLTAETAPVKMIRACLAPFRSDERAFEDFLDWLLFAFGDLQTATVAATKEARFRHFSEAFDLALLIEHPGDWIGHLYETENASKGTRDATGFFSTPPTICKAMVQMSMLDAPLTATVNEPCCGTGRILMEASNYAVHLSGQDINETLVKIAKVNGWLYMPSLVMPCPELATTMTTFSATVQVREEAPPASTEAPKEATAATNLLPKERTTTWTTPALFPES